MLHLAALLLTFLAFKRSPLLFIGAEMIILVSAILAWRLYRELIKPLQLVTHAIASLRDRDFNTKFICTGNYEMDMLIGVYNDMIDQLRRERTMSEEQHFFLEKLIFTSPIGIMIFDLDGNVYEINPQAARLLNIDEKTIIGKTLGELHGPLMQTMDKMGSGESRTVILNDSGTYKLQKSHFIDRGYARFYILIEEMTTEILAAEKRAYGKIIRLMAHEVNNTIGAVNSILQTTVDARQYNGSIGHALQIAIERNDNLSIFMRKYADLVRLPPPDKKPVDIVQLIQRVMDLMRLQAGEKNITFRAEYATPAYTILADAQQMEHVLINIIKNALEAIGEKGELTIFTHSTPPCMVIRDSGKGIDPANQSLLFTPFFSTKKDGQGLGLTLIREVLVNHGFRLSLQTIAPGITEFTVRF